VLNLSIYVAFALVVVAYDANADSVGKIQLRGPSHRQLQTIGQVENLRLINADTDLPIVNLTNGMVINVALTASNFNIQATTTNGTVGSIQFGYNGNSKYRIDSAQPFSLCPTPGGSNYETCTALVVGQHTFTVTPYFGTAATGIAGAALQITFNITKAPQVRLIIARSIVKFLVMHE
jgi:hypothetical protein